MREAQFEYILKNKLSGEIVKQVLTLDELQRGDCLLCGAGVVIYDVIAKRQSTGLRDKNGIEIYVGDILNVANGSINGRIGFSIYEVRHFAKGFTLPYFCWDDKGNNVMYWSHYCEVVGNKWENHELYAKEK